MSLVDSRRLAELEAKVAELEKIVAELLAKRGPGRPPNQKAA